MATKLVNLYTRMEPDVKIPPSRPVTISALSEAELNAELQKGYGDSKAGRVKEASAVFAEIRKDYNV